MVKYLDQCESAKERGLVRQLDQFPHFRETANQFSLADMELIRDNRLLPDLKGLHEAFASHIRQTCKVSYPSVWVTCVDMSTICELDFPLLSRD